jgi:hypothetical protein
VAPPDDWSERFGTWPWICSFRIRRPIAARFAALRYSSDTVVRGQAVAMLNE